MKGTEQYREIVMVKVKYIINFIINPVVVIFTFLQILLWCCWFVGLCEWFVCVIAMVPFIMVMANIATFEDKQ